jgi:hypothetical protein
MQAADSARFATGLGIGLLDTPGSMPKPVECCLLVPEMLLFGFERSVAARHGLLN